MMTHSLDMTGSPRDAVRGLDPDDLEALRAVAVVRRYPPGMVLVHEGAVEHVFYVVTEGSALVYQTLPDGHERPLYLKRPGEFFGEMALVDDSVRTASVRAQAPLTVLEITEELFDEMLQRSPTLAAAVLRNAVRSLRDSDVRTIEELRAKNELLDQAYRELQSAQAQLVEREVLRREVEVAAALQRDMLPVEFPTYCDLAFAAHNTPAHQVGGDLYDVLWVDADHLGLLLADVSDKGVHAALYMAITHTLFHTWSRHAPSPAEVARHVHEGLLDASSRDEMFVTAFYGVLNCKTREMRYVRAGQDRPLLVPGDGSPVRELPGDGRFLGMMEALALEEYCYTLAPGDALVVYSDGVPDAANERGERYGTGRLRALLEGLRGRPAARLTEAIVADVLAHQGASPQFDDMTLLVVTALEPECR